MCCSFISWMHMDDVVIGHEHANSSAFAAQTWGLWLNPSSWTLPEALGCVTTPLFCYVPQSGDQQSQQENHACTRDLLRRQGKKSEQQ